MFVTFARPGLYPAYLNPEDRLGILPLLRNDWGLDRQNDQQFGGLLMWVPANLVFFGVATFLFARWIGSSHHPMVPS